MAESSSSDGTTNPNEEPKVIRYTKEFLLSLHDSPLAVKPDNFPGLSLWFGDDWQSANTKGALNGSTSPKTLDKNIVLGPPKTSFNSSVFGGLKHSEDASQGGKAGSNYSPNRTRQGHEGRNTRENNSTEPRSQRTPHPMNDRTFVRDRNSVSERGFRNPVDKSSGDFQSRTTRMRQTERHSDRSLEPSRNKRENNRDNNSARNAKGHSDHNERTPEWMDYDPESESASKSKQSEAKEIETDGMNDLELWKSKMKKQDQEKNKDAEIQKSVEQKESRNVKANVDDLFANYPSNVADTTMAFDNFVISGPGARLSSSASANTNSKGGSRFAKFFSSKQHEVDQPSIPAEEPKSPMSPPVNDGTPKSISLDTLFQSHNANPKPQSSAVLAGKRMLSENDILQSMGANKPSPQPADNASDAAGFNKVLEALSMSKPVVPHSPHNPSQQEFRSPSNDQFRSLESAPAMLANRVGPLGMQQPHNPVHGVNSISESDVAHMQHMQSVDQRRQTESKYSPAMMRGSPYNEYPPQNPPGRARMSSPSANPERPKMLASNLPTSVLRQLSAKSSDSPGRSTSPNVSKQVSSYSPTPQRSMQAGPYPQHSDPSPYGGYNSMHMYQRGPPVAGGYPGSPMEIAGQNMSMEQLMQMRNSLHNSNAQQPSQRGAVPPMAMMGNMPPFPPYMMNNPPGSMQGPPPGFPADVRPPPKEHFMGMLPGANMSNPGAIPPPFYQQGPGGSGMGMNARMMHPSFDDYERPHGGKP